MKICLDPGHNASGADTGAEGNGLREQDLTLAIARYLKPMLEQNGFEVVTTRDGDFVNGPHGSINESLQTRCDIANASGADLFVSIHINSGGGTGTEVYCLPAGRAEKLANVMLYYLAQLGWANRGVKNANYYVLVNTDMPAILTENGFIDTQDAQILADQNILKSIAIAHAKGICDYAGVPFKDESQTPTVENNDPDIYLSVRVRTSKADALVKQIIGMGYACKKLDLA